MNKAEVFRHYQDFRRETFELNKKLVSMISERELFDGIHRLGIPVQGRDIQFGSENEMDILMDFCLHALLDEHGKSVAERILEDPNAPLDEHEREVLAPLARSRFVLFEVVRSEPGLGVDVRNLLAPTAAPIFVMDYQFSRTAFVGMRMAGRLVFLPEFTMTTGACLPLGSLGQKLPDLVRRTLTKSGAVPNAAGEFDRKADAEIHEVVMSVLIETGHTDTIAYRRLPTSAGPGRHKRPGKAGK